MIKKLLITTLLFAALITVSFAANEYCMFKFENVAPRNVSFSIEVPANYSVRWMGSREDCYKDRKLHNDCSVAFIAKSDCHDANFKLIDQDGNLVNIYTEYESEITGQTVQMHYPHNLYTLEVEQAETRRYGIIINTK